MANSIAKVFPQIAAKPVPISSGSGAHSTRDHRTRNPTRVHCNTKH